MRVAWLGMFLRKLSALNVRCSCCCVWKFEYVVRYKPDGSMSLITLACAT